MDNLSPVQKQLMDELINNLKAKGKLEEVPTESEGESSEVTFESHSKISLRKHLEACVNIQKPTNSDISALIKHSDDFPVKFPVETVRCKWLLNEHGIRQDTLEHFANHAFPVVHESVLALYAECLEHKKMYGSSQEILMYSTMTLVDFMQRLLEKRAVCFYGPDDKYRLLDGTEGKDVWTKSGAETSKTLNISNCLTYDEMKLSALLCLSSYSIFINDGSRNNSGVVPPSVRTDVERSGAVISVVGARFEKPGFMEWQEVIISQEQNTENNGYGRGNTERTILSPGFHWRRIWSDFYNVKPYFPLYEDITDNDRKMSNRYTILKDGKLIFDNDVYIKRLSISIETLLLDAQHRASASKTMAYIHVVGIGLGVWKLSLHQEKLFLDAFSQCLIRLLPMLYNVTDVNFAWFKETSCGGVENEGMFTSHGTHNSVRILFSKRMPHARLAENDRGKLLVVSYPGDSNALPGNEFWRGFLTSSGNTSEASSSQISELHNPHINKNKICGRNLHVATLDWGVIHISEYAKMKLNSV